MWTNLYEAVTSHQGTLLMMLVGKCLNQKSTRPRADSRENRVRAVLKRTDNAYDSELFGPDEREFFSELSPSDADRTIVETHLSVIDE